MRDGPSLNISGGWADVSCRRRYDSYPGGQIAAPVIDMHVSPVTPEGSTTWSTYLPEGEWVDVWTGEVHQGCHAVERDVPIDEVPVYCTSDGWTRLAKVFQPRRLTQTRPAA